MNAKIRTYILNDIYDWKLEVKPYSFYDMEYVLQKFYDEALKNETGSLSRYLLHLRRDFFFKEVLQNAESDLSKALIGIYSISPYVVNTLVSSKGINVFLARDAARDFVTAKLMDDLQIKKNNSVIIYLARKNLKEVYQTTEKVIYDIRCTSKADDDWFYLLRQEFTDNKKFRGGILYVYDILKESGIMAYEHIRFIDTWASGTIFHILSFTIRLFDEHQFVRGKPNNVKEWHHHKVSFRVANSKKRITAVKTYYDYINVASSFERWWELPKLFYEHYKCKKETSLEIVCFQCNNGAITKELIHKWYSSYRVMLGREIDPVDFCELLGAQIYKKLNHFGSLNLGHPIEWNDENMCVIHSEAHKKLGDLLRYMFLINAVLGYSEGHSNKLTQRITREEDIIKIKENRISLVIKEFSLNRYKARMLDKVLYDHNEHVATCQSEIVRNFIHNIIVTMEVLGFRTIAHLDGPANYDFQYYINSIRNIPSQDYLDRLKKLISIYGRDIVRRMFKKSIYHFIKEITNARLLYENVNRNVDCIVFDIDGTITPLDDGIDIVARCIRGDKRVVFITGRPPSFCTKLGSQLKSKLGNRFQESAGRIIFYCSNGSQVIGCDGKVYEETKSISHVTRSKLYHLCKELGLDIVSERNYRIIAAYRKKDKNANELLVFKEKIENDINDQKVGVYLISWGAQEQDETLPYDAIDISASNKEAAFEDMLKKMAVDRPTRMEKVLVIGDEPENTDKGIMSDISVSVEGYGILKTKAVIDYILSRNKR